MGIARDMRILEQGLAEYSSLQRAGLRVDAARAQFTAFWLRGFYDEREFGEAEAAYIEARDDFRHQLEMLTGMDADVIAGRV